MKLFLCLTMLLLSSACFAQENLTASDWDKLRNVVKTALAPFEAKWGPYWDPNIPGQPRLAHNPSSSPLSEAQMASIKTDTVREALKKFGIVNAHELNAAQLLAIAEDAQVGEFLSPASRAELLRRVPRLNFKKIKVVAAVSMAFAALGELNTANAHAVEADNMAATSRSENLAGKSGEGFGGFGMAPEKAPSSVDNGTK